MSSVMSHRTMGHCTSVVWSEIFFGVFFDAMQFSYHCLTNGF